MKIFISLIIIILLLEKPCSTEDTQNENNLPVPDMIRNYGYEVETHKVTTKDGYILTLHRIPKTNSVGTVFLMHGLFGTSADFVMGRPDKSLAYCLFDFGLDVWLGNARGNLYSQEHETLSVDDVRYWEFSFDEIGKYDIPSSLNYILSLRNVSLTYIGHSMGTVVFWIAMNEHGEFNHRISRMIALGPVATVRYIRSPIRYLAPFVHDITFLFHLLGINQFSPSNSFLQLFDKYVCDLTIVQEKICENILFLLTGYDSQQMNLTLLPIILGHEPGGTSTRTVLHFAQEVNSGVFSKYDHGEKDNMIIYNSSSPPLYDLTKVTLPVYLLWSNNDWLADPKDVEFLVNTLPNLPLNYKVPDAKFNHVDFLWGLNADKLIFSVIQKILEDNHFKMASTSSQLEPLVLPVKSTNIISLGKDNNVNTFFDMWDSLLKTGVATTHFLSTPWLGITVKDDVFRLLVPADAGNPLISDTSLQRFILQNQIVFQEVDLEDSQIESKGIDVETLSGKTVNIKKEFGTFTVNGQKVTAFLTDAQSGGKLMIVDEELFSSHEAVSEALDRLPNSPNPFHN